MNKAVTVLHCDRFCIIAVSHPRSAQPISKTALSQSLFVLQSSVCLYGLAFALSHSLFVLQSFVYLYGFAFALSPSLFVGERACPSRCTKPFHSHNHLKRTSIPRSTPHSPQKNKKIRHLSKQRILYIQFSAIVKMVSGSKAIMFYGTHSTSP